MDRIPSTQEVTCQLRKTRAKIRLKNAQLEGLLDYTSAGYNQQTLDYHQSMVHGLVHRLSTLENELSSLELSIKDYISAVKVPKRDRKVCEHPSSKTDSGIGMGQDDK
ncbi:uncharacterized protein LOC111121342 [Crassostrea virginica]